MSTQLHKSHVQKNRPMGKNLQATANVLLNDLKAIGKNTTKLAGDAVDQVHKNAKHLLQRADKKFG